MYYLLYITRIIMTFTEFCLLSYGRCSMSAYWGITTLFVGRKKTLGLEPLPLNVSISMYFPIIPCPKSANDNGERFIMPTTWQTLP